jgi:APA family basic amino acid/polyamine antiporter
MTQNPQMSEAAPATSRVFSRSASGLVRVAGPWDVFIYNVGLVSVGIAIAFNQYYGPSLYPGAAVWLSTLLAALGMLFVAATFYFWAIIFPRSGGVYVSLSRTTTPLVAFVLSLLETMVLLYYGALAASLIVTVGLSSFLATVGGVADSGQMQSWAASVAEPAGVFWIGTLLLVLAGGLLSSGTRRYFVVQKVLFIVAVLGTLVLIAVMLFGSRSRFQENLSSIAGLDYDTVIATARDQGFATSDYSFSDTLKFLVWPLLPLLGAVQSIGLGGEVKRVRRAQLLGMLGAVGFTAVLIAFVSGLAAKSFGNEFQGAIAWNSLNGVTDGSTEGTIGAAPWFSVLAGILAGNSVIAAIVMATFAAWIWFWIPAELAYTTRSMIAWSFDRIAPDRLGYVSRRFHTPTVAIALSTAIAVFFMWLIAYRNIALLTLIEVILIVWGVAAASAIVFPWVRRSFFQRSPASEWRLAGLPLMSIVGVIALAFFVLAFVLLWRDPTAAGPMVGFHHATREFWVTLGVAVFGLVWYIGMKVYRRSQGVDLGLAFREIPIE